MKKNITPAEEGRAQRQVSAANRAQRRASGQITRRTGQATVRKSSRRRPSRRPIIMVP